MANKNFNQMFFFHCLIREKKSEARENDTYIFILFGSHKSVRFTDLLKLLGMSMMVLPCWQKKEELKCLILSNWAYFICKEPSLFGLSLCQWPLWLSFLNYAHIKCRNLKNLDTNTKIKRIADKIWFFWLCCIISYLHL